MYIYFFMFFSQVQFCQVSSLRDMYKGFKVAKSNPPSSHPFQLHAMSGELEIPGSGVYTPPPPQCAHFKRRSTLEALKKLLFIYLLIIMWFQVKHWTSQQEQSIQYSVTILKVSVLFFVMIFYYYFLYLSLFYSNIPSFDKFLQIRVRIFEIFYVDSYLRVIGFQKNLRTQFYEFKFSKRLRRGQVKVNFKFVYENSIFSYSK